MKQGSGGRLCPLSRRIRRREKPFLELKGHGSFLFEKNWFSTVLAARLTTQARTASDMDGTLHTDLAGFENIRDIKKVL